MAKKTNYDEDKIKTLTSFEHIRLRAGMYIGRKSDGSQYEDGIYILLKEVIDNAIDEHIMGAGNKVDVTVNYDSGEVAVRDYGRGIPLGKVVECVSQINTGGKYNTDAFQFSTGLNGVGTKAVNALSKAFLVRSVREGEYVEASFSKGELLKKSSGKVREPNGTFVQFTPDEEMFPKYRFLEEHVIRRMRMYAYLNAGLTIRLNGKEILSRNGLVDLINDESQHDQLYAPIRFRSKTLELAFTHTNRYSENYYSFVNGQYTNDGGTHLSAFKEGILKAVNEFSKNKKYDGDDVREGIVGAIAIRLKDPVFESQTKNKLGNTEIRADLVAEVKKVVEAELHRDAATAEKLVEKIEATARLRKEISSVKKTARERARASSVNIDGLSDCKYHRNARKASDAKKGEESSIFITEGLSASGTISKARNADVQAVFSLRGKPLNVWNLERPCLVENKEFFNLLKALGLVDANGIPLPTIDDLRYQKVILATDADVDGLHIRNLMITFFIRFFDKVVKDGHLFVLETPLFRVRNKKNENENYFCYSEQEREKALAKCGKNAEITRFKGLGEISSEEFKGFIGKNIRLRPVDMMSDTNIYDTIRFYMGNNTADRYNYIMDNLIVDASEV